METKVVLVKEGSWGQNQEGDNDDVIAGMAEFLSQRQEDDSQILNDHLRVVVVDSAEQAEAEMAGGGVVIFFSRGIEKKAKALAEKFQRRVRVIVVTGLVPNGEIIWVKKSLLDLKSFRRTIESNFPL